MPYSYKMALAVLTPQFFIVTYIYQEFDYMSVK